MAPAYSDVLLVKGVGGSGGAAAWVCFWGCVQEEFYPFTTIESGSRSVLLREASSGTRFASGDDVSDRLAQRSC